MCRRVRLIVGLRISCRDDCRSFDHENDGALRRACAVNDPFRYDVSLLRLKIDRLIFEINDEVTVEDKEELIVIVMLVPVVLPLHHAKPGYGIVHFAKRLVVPTVGAGVDQRRNVNQPQHRESNIEIRRV
jgi:hypothetical protein